MVKELRERTGAGMMECKKGARRNDGDPDAAAESLRKSGQAKADKKSGRIAADGRIVISSEGAKAVIAESQFGNRLSSRRTKLSTALPTLSPLRRSLRYD